MASTVHCPFLYQTRTILRQRPRLHRAWQRSIASTSGPDPIRSDANIASTQENNEPPNFLQQKAIDVLAKKSQTKPRSRISKQKVVSLDDIWKLFETSTSPTSTSEQKQDLTIIARNHTETDHEAILELFSSAPERGQNQTYSEREANTMSRTATSASPYSFSVLPSSQTTKSAAVAEIADYLSDQPKNITKPHQQHDDLLTKTAQSIMSDISASFNAAIASSPRSDHAIWRVSEEKIFPLIKLLIPSRSSLSKPLSTSSPPQASNPSPNPNSIPTSIIIPPNLPLLPLLSRIYPSSLLLALRLLYTQTPTSPYTSALLPHIKSLGPTSYVLGANTYFYNLLLTLRWDVYSDFRAVDKLLGEMERNGVEFDQGTMEVLRVIEEERKVGVHGRDVDRDGSNRSEEEEIVNKLLAKRGKGKAKGSATAVEDGDDQGAKLDYGSRGRDWWTRTEVVKGLDRIREWQGVVRRKLEERGLGEVMREGGEDSDNNNNHGNNNNNIGGLGAKDRNVEDAYVVTL